MPRRSRFRAGPLDRRSFLSGVGAVVTATGAALVQPLGAAPRQTGRTRGPLVWLDMDQQELDDAYNQSVYAPNMAHVSRRLDNASDAARRRLAPRRVSYGSSPI